MNKIADQITEHINNFKAEFDEEPALIQLHPWLMAKLWAEIRPWTDMVFSAGLMNIPIETYSETWSENKDIIYLNAKSKRLYVECRVILGESSQESERNIIYRVYIAGPYSADNPIDMLNNMRAGMRAATELMQHGNIAPFCPFLDYHFQLQLREGESLSVEGYYRYSMAWLEVSDAMLLLEGWGNSKGAKEEFWKAKHLRMPTFYFKKNLFAWINEMEGNK